MNFVYYYIMDSINIPSDLKKVNQIFEKNGFKAYLVGGAVRDSLRNKAMHDWDLATNARPEDVMRIFKRVIPTGIAHGTVTIHIFGHEIETTTFRAESGYSDGRHPDKISYAESIEEDLSRRDFTINAIAAELGTGKLVDPFGGREDIKRRVIRTVGSAMDRFSEDGLRPVRAVRFSGQLGFEIDAETLDAMKNPEVLKITSKISVERFRDEFCKMLTCEKPSVCLNLLEKTGILDIFIPEFGPCRGCTQSDGRGFHDFDVADHLFYAVDGSPRDNLTVALAAFYHDIGKPEARKTEIKDGHELIHFHRHEMISAEKAEKSMRKLKFPNDAIKKVTHLVKEHMFFYTPNWSNAAVRRFLIRVGQENFEDLMQLRLADIYGMHNCPLKDGSPEFYQLAELRTRVEKALAEKSAMSIKDLAVNGRDLENAGIPKGKAMGIILRELFETVTDSPEMNEREKLLNLAVRIWKEKMCR